MLYRLHDVDGGGAIPVTLDEADKYNRQGYGIFETVNEFNGPRRITNLRRVRAWAIDMDVGTKNEMLTRINQGLPPTWINETKRGYQVWFAAKDAQPQHWNSIVLDRLVPFYGADKNARDLARILRVPGFYHMKDPNHPYMVTTVWSWKVGYTESQMAYWYKDQGKPQREAFIKSHQENIGGDESIWEKIWRIDCADFLMRVSGTEWVGCETYELKSVANGNQNIWVNGKSTANFIDKEFRIGSLSDGGPTCANWLHWFGHPWSKVIDILKSIYPELEDTCSK